MCAEARRGEARCSAVAGSQPERRSEVRKLLVAAWEYHKSARAVRDKGGLGDAIGGRNLWYQARGPPSRCVRMVDVEGSE